VRPFHVIPAPVSVYPVSSTGQAGGKLQWESRDLSTATSPGVRLAGRNESFAGRSQTLNIDAGSLDVVQLLLMLAFTLLGLFVGSFLNVCIDRLPREQSIISPPSHCPGCKRKLGPLDLVPLFSYLWLRGRCRYCRAPIPVRTPIVEGTTALLFTFLYWRFGLGLELGISLLYASLLIVIFVIDLEHQLVLNKVTYPAMVAAFGLSFLPSEPGVWSSLLGGALGLAAMALPFIIYRRGMGMGDVKLGALIGLMSGYPSVLVALLLAVVAGGLVGATLLVLGVKKRTDPIPFGPFLAASAMVALLWGEAIWRWYV
jgi:leader peptidase (prepilin peptidase) / N-methyltransferase